MDSFELKLKGLAPADDELPGDLMKNWFRHWDQFQGVNLSTKCPVLQGQ